MSKSQSDNKPARPLRGGERVMYLLGVEAQTLADHLDELPTDAEINALEDEVGRRRAKVAARKAMIAFQKLNWRLQLAIAKLTELLDANGPVARGTSMAGAPGGHRRKRS